MRSLLGVLVLLFCGQYATALDIDDKIRLIVSEQQISPATCNIISKEEDSRITELGKLIFETPILSGDHDVSCSNCHIDEKELADGLPLAIGVGGDGEGFARMNSGGVIVPRNAFTLVGRAHPDFNVFFWDGKITKSDGLIYSPIGEGFEAGFQSPLAVASVLPIIARDEFLGKYSLVNQSQHVRNVDRFYYADRMAAANSALQELLDHSDSEDARKARAIMASLGKESINLALAGNAIAAFLSEKLKTSCVPSNWDKYLKGDMSSITEDQKVGALLFFGKGRCSVCHSGSLFSDMEFHSLGVPQGDLGPYMHGRDIGRAGVTFESADLYKFRTPPLLSVSKTMPYGHNGEFDSLREMVYFHINPIHYFSSNGWTSEDEIVNYGNILSSRSELLSYISLDKAEEVEFIIQFLEAL